MLLFRESDDIRKILDIKGDTFYLRKSAHGWSEEYLFYDEEGNLIEEFTPMTGQLEIEGFHEFSETVWFNGININAEFKNEDFYL